LRHPADEIAKPRRQFLGAMALAPLALAGAPAFGAVAERALALRHTHTGERLEIAYFAHGEYLPAALARLDWLLRDFRTGDARRIDARLYDILHALCAQCGGGEIEIISAYRSPRTNAQLRAASRGVAERSLHLEGRAIDIRLAGSSTARLRDAAVALGEGGVGYYPKSDFVHLDTGRARQWGPRGA
jgi:uncharacterized protein YcbK (DUF882 family)